MRPVSKIENKTVSTSRTKKNSCQHTQKVIAPVFKRLGIIDQWGNGLKLIASELKEYPNIELRWKEVGLSFQVQFVKLDYLEKQELQQELQRQTLYSEVLYSLVHKSLSRQDIFIALGQKKYQDNSIRLFRNLLQTA